MTTQKRKEQRRLYRLANREKVNEQRRKMLKRYYEKYPWLKHLQRAKDRCRYKNSYLKKGIRCFLTKEEVKKIWFRDKAYELDRASIDRKDSLDHYTYDNCRFIEYIENLIRPKTFICAKCGHSFIYK